MGLGTESILKTCMEKNRSKTAFRDECLEHNQICGEYFAVFGEYAEGVILLCKNAKY